MSTAHERSRLEALQRYDVMDTEPEEAFDRLTALAADLFDAPVALVSLVDAERQWLKSRFGTDLTETPREHAFCAHLLQTPRDEVMVVPDATGDPRFQSNPLVTGPTGIRFYAGAPLVTEDGFGLGSLCVIDTTPRPTPSTAELRRLSALARLAVDELELRLTRRMAAGAARAKAQFLANMSHEVRTPLHGVLGYADLMLGTSLDGQQRVYAERIQVAGRYLLDLVNDVLDASRMEAGRLKTEQEPFDLTAVLQACCDLVAPTAESKGLQLDVVCSDLPPRVLGDRLRVQQVVMNLLGNAVKFTDSGRVSVRAEADGGDSVVIRVEDSGPGIPADRLSAVFDLFEQADAGTARRHGGSGLGLGISRQLSGLMGGTLVLASTVGRGTTATLTLPLPAAAVTLAPPVVVEPDEPGHSGRILLVDDMEIIREVAAAFLRHSGHVVTLVDSGAAALAALSAGTYDLVLLDMQMPEMDGPTTARAIRGLAGPASAVPILALTANVSPQAAQACLDAGMNGHVCKPISREALLEAVGPWLPQTASAGGARSAA